MWWFNRTLEDELRSADFKSVEQRLSASSVVHSRLLWGAQWPVLAGDIRVRLPRLLSGLLSKGTRPSVSYVVVTSGWGNAVRGFTNNPTELPVALIPVHTCENQSLGPRDADALDGACRPEGDGRILRHIGSARHRREVAALVKLLATANRCQSRAGKLRNQCLMSEFEEVKPGFPVELGLISLASCS